MRREQYLAKADEADEQAAKANVDYNRNVWKVIANNYRELASVRETLKDR